MVDLIQMTSRMFYRSFVVAMAVLIWDQSAYWGIPLGLLVGFGSEARKLIGKE